MPGPFDPVGDNYIYLTGREFVSMVPGYSSGDYTRQKLSLCLLLRQKEGLNNECAYVTDIPINSPVYLLVFCDVPKTTYGYRKILISANKLGSIDDYVLTASVYGDTGVILARRIDVTSLTGNFYIKLSARRDKGGCCWI